jgi:hypothetical protein
MGFAAAFSKKARNSKINEEKQNRKTQIEMCKV